MCTNAALGLGLISWCFPPAAQGLAGPPALCSGRSRLVPWFPHRSVVLSVVRAGCPGSLVEEYLIFESCARIPGPPTASVVLRAVRAWCPGSLMEEYLIFESCARIPGPPTASVVLSAVPGWCHGPLVEEYRPGLSIAEPLNITVCTSLLKNAHSTSPLHGKVTAATRNKNCRGIFKAGNPVHEVWDIGCDVVEAY
ncbi:hypothetical protein B0H14DRAFT_2655139 [Mycena olivaceomarginata]|nr:hypothetical protein B0H14DRAFT_2655139 [Mycena olivaceomarginata]